MMMTARRTGVLDGGEVSSGHYCVWLRTGDGNADPLIWPAEFSARLDPLEILDGQGAVVATAGQQLVLTGGLTPVDKTQPCSLGRGMAFSVQQIQQAAA
jgi:hypothetical protein